MSVISTIRHDEIFNAQENDQSVTIIGVGAIGSRIFAALAELGLTNITCYDFDDVEAHNLANQMYGHGDLGKPKVVAMADWFKTKTGVHHRDVPKMRFVNEAVTPETDISGTVFLLVDSMKARREIFENNIRDNTNVYRVIDVRMASTHGNVITFNPHNDEGDEWLKTLISDDLAEESACGSSLTVGTTASLLANLAAWQYMLAKTDKSAVSNSIVAYFKPLIVVTHDRITT